MIQKVYEVDPLVCPQCGGQIRIISFLIDYAVADKIIDHLKLTFVANRLPPDSDRLSGILDGCRDLG